MTRLKGILAGKTAARMTISFNEACRDSIASLQREDVVRDIRQELERGYAEKLQQTKDECWARLEAEAADRARKADAEMQARVEQKVSERKQAQGQQARPAIRPLLVGDLLALGSERPQKDIRANIAFVLEKVKMSPAGEDMLSLLLDAVESKTSGVFLKIVESQLERLGIRGNVTSNIYVQVEQKGLDDVNTSACKIRRGAEPQRANRQATLTRYR
jgi:hypothetical protein